MEALSLYIFIAAGALFGIYLAMSSLRKPATYINSRGYVVLSEFNELEHRYIAIQLLKRNLERNEVVHHINGKKTDNRVLNLCLMNRQKHEHFHAWLRWKKEKSGRYPSFSFQKKVLEQEYGGTLLENVKFAKTREPQNQVYDDKPIAHEQLFHELRKERKRLALERNIPVYYIFDNNTLREISEVMPESESALLKITGVGPAKLQMYGPQFIRVVTRFKKDA